MEGKMNDRPNWPLAISTGIAVSILIGYVVVVTLILAKWMLFG